MRISEYIRAGFGLLGLTAIVSLSFVSTTGLSPQAIIESAQVAGASTIDSDTRSFTVRDLNLDASTRRTQLDIKSDGTFEYSLLSFDEMSGSLSFPAFYFQNDTSAPLEVLLNASTTSEVDVGLAQTDTYYPLITQRVGLPAVVVVEAYSGKTFQLVLDGEASNIGITITAEVKPLD